MKLKNTILILLLFFAIVRPALAVNSLTILEQSEQYLQQGMPHRTLELLKNNNLLGKLEAIHLQAQALLQLGNYQEVIDLLTNITNPSDWETFYYLGLAYFGQGQYEQALNQLQKGLAIRPHTTLIINQLAETFASMGQYQAAINQLQRSLQYDASQTNLYWKIGALADQIGDLQQAYTAYTKAEAMRSVPEISKRINELMIALNIDPTKGDPSRPEPKLIKHSTVVRDKSSKLIRIGLIEDASNVTFSAGSDFTIIDGANQKHTGKGNQLWEISTNGKNQLILSGNNQKLILTQPVKLQLLNDSTTFALYNVDFGTGYFWAGTETREYRGDLEFLLAAKGITVVNELPVEEYLYSVVPGEMSASWHMEALKAQAVAARTYTEYNRGRYQSRGFDLLATVQSANYPGVSREHPRTTQAVQETRGEVLLYNGRPIDAVYSANNGGIRSSSKDVWGGHRDYLQSGSDGDKLPQDTYSLARWLRIDPPVYSNIGRLYSTLRWTRHYTREDLQRIAPASIGKLIDVKITAVADSYRVQSIQWIGSYGTYTVRNDAIRSSLGGLRSNLFIFYPVYHDNILHELTIYGAGWGHGVGMSQYGALGMAEAGFNYKEILKFYYDIEI